MVNAIPKRNVVLFIAIGGVGKTTLINNLVSLTPNSVKVSIGDLLIEKFGYPKSELNRVPMDQQIEAKRETLLRFIQENQDKETIFNANHIYIPSSNGTLENVWVPEVLAYTKAAYFLYAHPQEIQARIIGEGQERATRRNRPVDSIRSDQEKELEAFRGLVAPYVFSRELISTNSSVNETSEIILKDLEDLRSSHPESSTYPKERF